MYCTYCILAVIYSRHLATLSVLSIFDYCTLHWKLCICSTGSLWHCLSQLCFVIYHLTFIYQIIALFLGVSDLYGQATVVRTDTVQYSTVHTVYSIQYIHTVYSILYGSGMLHKLARKVSSWIVWIWDTFEHFMYVHTMYGMYVK